MYNQVIKLVKSEQVKTRAGGYEPTKTAREVFAKVKSVWSSEFYRAASIGKKAEATFELADNYDYEGEELIEYNGIEYRLIRVGENPKTKKTELIASRIIHGGGNGNGSA